MIPSVLQTKTGYGSLARALHGLPQPYQTHIRESYQRILPVLLRLTNSRAIVSRNRTWAGSSPADKGVTRLLMRSEAGKVRVALKAYASVCSENVEELLHLLRAYCQYGPIGLIDALPNDLPPLLSDELIKYVACHRLGKYPRSDGGLYIRENLHRYAEHLGEPVPSAFVARYAWSADRYVERWYVGENASTDYLTKTTRRLNLAIGYPHRRWIAQSAPLPIHCSVSQRDQAQIQPWLIWMIDEYTKSFMGMRVCATPPTARDICLLVRWSIWHYDAPWWPARGIPDEVVLPACVSQLDRDAQAAFNYLRTRYSLGATIGLDSYAGLPANLKAWLSSHGSHLPGSGGRDRTLADLREILLEIVRDEMEATVSARQVPVILREQGCSLLWSTGIAAALLLPSAGQSVVASGRVTPWRVPYDAGSAGLVDGTPVDVRYDPDDMRRVFAIHNGAHVAVVPACAFEHRVNCWDLDIGV